MRKFVLSLSFVAAVLTLDAGFATRAAAQYCEGKVHGLSRNYNAATGSGFLAVRAGPRRSASQIGELFNGDKVEIFDRRGNWYRVAALDGTSDGWASARWIRNDCRY